MLKSTTLIEENISSSPDASSKIDYNILVNSPLAWFATFMFRGKPTAMVIGKTIHLSGVSKKVFLQDKSWLAHELIHVQQFQRYGLFYFLLLYIIESVRKGYYMNKFEIEARNGEVFISE
jgi:hypothetical protein